MYRFMEKFYAKPGESLASHTKKLIECVHILESLGYIVDEVMLKELYIACRDHDLGKINSYFQQRVSSQKKKKFDSQTEVGHNILSAFLTDLGEELDEESYFRVVNAVLNHHHYVDNYEEMEEKEGCIRKILKEISSIIGEEVGGKYTQTEDILYKRLGTRKRKKVREAGDTTRGKLLKGFVHKCDYAASAGMPIEFKNDFLEECMDKMNYTWNDLQNICIQNRNKNLFITASTGMGKTEAALLWLGNTKGIYVLPLQVAINAIYDRIKRDVIKDKDTQHRLGLLHGNTPGVYLDKNSKKSDPNSETTENQKFFDYYENTRNMSLALTITTPDQIFDFVYRYEGYELRLATLSYSKVIIDEIQAYSPDLLAYLVYAIKQIVKIGGKFAVLTATFPPFVRDLLMKAYKEALEERKGKAGEDFLSALGEEEGICERTFFSEKDRHHLHLVDTRLDIEEIKRVYNRAEQKKILVVCNTVKQAQEIYDELEDECNVRLLHAKFVYKHRKSKEADILKDGRTFLEDGKTLNNKKIIWISTQIVEASLDIDFDYLFTELVDLNSLFQRLGRCNRKGAKKVDEPNCFIYMQIETNLFIKKERGFIDRTLHDLSKEALLSHGGGILTEREKVDLIETYLTTKRLQEGQSEYYQKYHNVYNLIENLYDGEKSFAQVKHEFRNIISYRAIPQELFDTEEEIPILLNELDKVCESIRNLSKEKSRDSTEEYINTRNQLRIDKMRLIENLREYCVNVGIYDVRDRESIEINDEKIYLVQGEYSEEKGFRRAKYEKGTEEEKWDAFL